MRIFAVNKDNDIHLDRRGQLAIATDLHALKQNLEHVMQSLFGEMIHHKRRGLPYQDCVWSGSPNLRQFEAFARVALKRERGVNSIEALSVWREGNTLCYAATIATIYGTVSVGNGTV